MTHDERDPSFALALYLDHSVPFDPEAKAAYLRDLTSRSRQFFLPVLRVISRLLVVLIQIHKIAVPKAFTSSRLLHRILEWGLKNFVSPEANLIILRHFHVASQLLAFIAANAPVRVGTRPLRPTRLDEVRNDLFLQHDLNLFNFIIRLNQGLRAENLTLQPVAKVDFDAITPGGFGIEAMPKRWCNVLDIQSAIEIFTPVYQLFLTDHDFWRAANSLQFDETITIYAATILNEPALIAMVNNRHPMVPDSTTGAAYRLMLHGLSAETLHSLLVAAKLGRMPRLLATGA
jgi:hypothetical protein